MQKKIILDAYNDNIFVRIKMGGKTFFNKN